MANKPIAADLTADLPEDWTYGQTVSPTGAEAGLPARYGYNYLMEKVNEALEAVNAINAAFPGLVAYGGDGKLNISTPGVTGVLGVGNGGTGQTTLEALASAIYGTKTSPLSKPNLLSDATATGMGLPASATPDQALAKLRSLISTAQSTADGRVQMAEGHYTGTGTSGSPGTVTLTFPFDPYILFIKGSNEPGFGCILNRNAYFGEGSNGALSLIISQFSYTTKFTSSYLIYHLNTEGKTYYYRALSKGEPL